MHPRPRTPSESGPGRLVRPGRSSGMRNAVMPRPRAPGCVAAKTIPRSAGCRVGDPDLAPRQPPASALSDRDGFLVGRIGPGVLFRKCEDPNGSARCQPAKPSRLLVLAAEPRDHFSDEVVCDDEDDGERGAGARNGLDASAALR